MERLAELMPIVREAWCYTVRTMNVFCLFHVTTTYLGNLGKLTGPSMLPTLDGQVVLMESITVRLGKVGSGDVVLIRSPENPMKAVGKRIVGVEGEEVSYAVDPLNSNERKTVVVPKGHVWVQGDNIYNSRDSRMFGPVPRAHLQSRIFLVVWPLKDFGFVDKRGSIS